MKIRKADASEAENLAGLNRQLIEDEQHLNPMSAQQLARRMDFGSAVCGWRSDRAATRRGRGRKR